MSASLLSHKAFVLPPTESLMKEAKVTAPHRDPWRWPLIWQHSCYEKTALQCPPRHPFQGPQSCVKFIILYLTIFKWLSPGLSDSSKTHLSGMSSVSWKFAEFELLSCLTGLTGAIKKRERKKRESNEKVVINTIKIFPFSSIDISRDTLCKHK